MPSPTHRHSLKSKWRHGAFMFPLTLIFTFVTTPQSFRTPIYMTNNFSKFYFSSLWRKWRQKIKYNKQRNNLIIAHLMSFVCKLLKELERLVGGVVKWKMEERMIQWRNSCPCIALIEGSPLCCWICLPTIFSFLWCSQDKRYLGVPEFFIKGSTVMHELKNVRITAELRIMVAGNSTIDSVMIDAFWKPKIVLHLRCAI